MGKHNYAVCEYCNKSVRSDNLQRHLKACRRAPERIAELPDQHTLCPSCGGSYRKSNLRSHIKSKHPQQSAISLRELRTRSSSAQQSIHTASSMVQKKKKVGRPYEGGRRFKRNTNAQWIAESHSYDFTVIKDMPYQLKRRTIHYRFLKAMNTRLQRGKPDFPKRKKRKLIGSQKEWRPHRKHLRAPDNRA